MPADHLAQRRAQHPGVDRAAHPHRAGDHIGRVRRSDLLQEPHALLEQREREDVLGGGARGRFVGRAVGRAVARPSFGEQPVQVRPLLRGQRGEALVELSHRPAPSSR